MKKAMKWIVSALVLAGLALVITGLFLDFTQTSSNGGGNILGSLQLFDGILEMETDMSNTIVAFSIMTAVFSAGTLVLTLLQAGKVVKAKLVRIVCAILTIACAIVAFAVTCAFAAEFLSIGGYSLATTAPAVGAYLLGIGGIVSGLFGLLPVRKK